MNIRKVWRLHRTNGGLMSSQDAISDLVSAAAWTTAACKREMEMPGYWSMLNAFPRRSATIISRRKLQSHELCSHPVVAAVARIACSPSRADYPSVHSRDPWFLILKNCTQKLDDRLAKLHLVAACPIELHIWRMPGFLFDGRSPSQDDQDQALPFGRLCELVFVEFSRQQR